MIKVWLISVFASLGAAAVAWGLYLESFDEKSKYRDIEDFRSSKRKSHRGQKWVFWGVVAEMLLGFFIAAWDGIQAYKNDPRNRPISTTSALATLVITEIPRPNFANMSSENGGEWNGALTFISGTSPTGSNVLLSLVASSTDVQWWNMGSVSNREWRITFHIDPFNFLTSKAAQQTVLVKQFDDVKGIILGMPFETNMVMVQTGTVDLVVNDLSWSFKIPKQKPKWNMVTMKEDRDSNGRMAAQIMKVRISDWVYPPRFTNAVYDGK